MTKQCTIKGKGREANFCVLLLFNVFFAFGCSSVFLAFLYVPFIFLRFLLSFQCFLWFFIRFPSFFCMFLLLSFLVFYSVFHLLFFLYFPFILLPFLLGFQCFLRFCGLFLSIRYTFCIVLLYSVYIAASQIASVSSILRLFLSILLSCLAISKSFSFNWLYVGLILMHFVQVLHRFNVFI